MQAPHTVTLLNPGQSLVSANDPVVEWQAVALHRQLVVITSCAHWSHINPSFHTGIVPDEPTGIKPELDFQLSC